MTEADKSEATDRSDYRSVGEDDYEHDNSAADQARPSANGNQAQQQQQQQSSSVRRGSGNRVVYGKLDRMDVEASAQSIRQTLD